MQISFTAPTRESLLALLQGHFKDDPVLIKSTMQEPFDGDYTITVDYAPGGDALAVWTLGTEAPNKGEIYWTEVANG